jgi:hypothetical protein
MLIRIYYPGGCLSHFHDAWNKLYPNHHTSLPLILTWKLSDFLATSTLSGTLSVGIKCENTFDE